MDKICKKICNYFFGRNREISNEIVERETFSQGSNMSNLSVIDYIDGHLCVRFMHLTSSKYREAIEKEGLKVFSPSDLKSKICKYLTEKFKVDENEVERFLNDEKFMNENKEDSLFLVSRIKGDASNVQNCIYCNYLPSTTDKIDEKLKRGKKIYLNGGEFLLCAENLYIKYFRHHDSGDNIYNSDKNDLIACIITEKLYFDDSSKQLHFNNNISSECFKVNGIEKTVQSSSEIKFKQDISFDRIEIFTEEEMRNLNINLISEKAKEYLESHK